MSRTPLFAQSLSSFGIGLLFFISAFLPPLGMYIVISIAIAGEYIFKIVGVLLFKMVELKKAQSLAASRTATMSLSEKLTGGNTPDKELERGLVGRVEEEFDGRIEKARREYKFPAINIEHHVDRLGAFVTIVLGEMVVSVFYHTSRASGLNQCARNYYIVSRMLIDFYFIQAKWQIYLRSYGRIQLELDLFRLGSMSAFHPCNPSTLAHRLNFHHDASTTITLAPPGISCHESSCWRSRNTGDAIIRYGDPCKSYISRIIVRSRSRHSLCIHNPNRYLLLLWYRRRSLYNLYGHNRDNAP